MVTVLTDSGYPKGTWQDNPFGNPFGRIDAAFFAEDDDALYLLCEDRYAKFDFNDGNIRLSLGPSNIHDWFD